MQRPIWISAGELSGEMHGAALVKELLAQDSSLSLVGMGGDMMANAGVDVRFHIKELSIMGFTEVLFHIPRIIGLLSRIRKAMLECKPQAIIVIDAPDFNFRIIKIAKSLGIPVYYYISPKVWAWRQKRALFIKENVRKLISILPFEVSFYKKFSMHVEYVGNPLVDIVDYSSIAHISPEKGLIGILPGSRKSEINSLMPVFGEAARALLLVDPTLRFQCICAPNMNEDILRSLWAHDVPLTIVSARNRWETMRHCQLLMAASGTVTLESAIAGVPTLVAYKMSSLSYALGKILIKVPYISLPNLIAGQEVFPELIQEVCNPERLKEKALTWLRDDSSLLSVQEKLKALRTLLGDGGAAKRAASSILRDIASL